MIDLSITNGVAEVVLNAPDKLNASRLRGAGRDWMPRTAAPRPPACGRCCCGARAAPSARAATSPASTRRPTTCRVPRRRVEAAAAADRAPSRRRRSRPCRARASAWAWACDRDGRRVRRGGREDRLAVRQPGRDAGLGRRTRSLRAAGRAPGAGPDLHRRADDAAPRRWRRGCSAGHARRRAARRSRASVRRAAASGPDAGVPRVEAADRPPARRAAVAGRGRGERAARRSCATPPTTARASPRSRRSATRPSRATDPRSGTPGA